MGYCKNIVRRPLTEMEEDHAQVLIQSMKEAEFFKELQKMVKIMMHGCNGVMGQVISKIVEETEGAVMACGVDRVDDGHNDYPVFTDINACDVEVDAIIDFSAKTSR